MEIREQYIEAIPSYWLCPLINGDYSALTLHENYESDKQEIDDFIDSLIEDNTSFVIDPYHTEDNSTYFGQFNGIGHDLIDVQITIFNHN